MTVVSFRMCRNSLFLLNQWHIIFLWTVTMNIHRARRRIARIRCLQDCIQCFKSKRQLPECVCYVPSELNYTCNARSFIQVYKEPSTNSARIRDVTGGVESSLVVSGEEMCNAEGKWLKLKKVRLHSFSIHNMVIHLWGILFPGLFLKSFYCLLW